MTNRHLPIQTDLPLPSMRGKILRKFRMKHKGTEAKGFKTVKHLCQSVFVCFLFLGKISTDDFGELPSLN